MAEKGYEGLTVEGVAERSGVNKTTIYRWWPSKAALLGAALLDADLLGFATPDTGSLHGDLVAVTRHIVALLTGSASACVAVAALGAAARTPELAAAARAFFADRLAKESVIFERARLRGELPAGADPMLVMDLLHGAVWMRAVFRGLPISDDFAEETVTVLLNGFKHP